MARFVPVPHGVFPEASLGAMVGHELGVIRYDFWKPGFQRGGNAAMQLLPSAAQQSAVGGIPHQGVLEGVLRIRRRSAPEDQLGARELVEGFVQLLLRNPRNGTARRRRPGFPVLMTPAELAFESSHHLFRMGTEIQLGFD